MSASENLAISINGQEIDPEHAMVVWRDASSGNGLIAMNLALNTEDLGALAASLLGAVLRIAIQREGFALGMVRLQEIAAQALRHASGAHVPPSAPDGEWVD